MEASGLPYGKRHMGSVIQSKSLIYGTSDVRRVYSGFNSLANRKYRLLTG